MIHYDHMNLKVRKYYSYKGWTRFIYEVHISKTALIYCCQYLHATSPLCLKSRHFFLKTAKLSICRRSSTYDLQPFSYYSYYYRAQHLSYIYIYIMWYCECLPTTYGNILLLYLYMLLYRYLAKVNNLLLLLLLLFTNPPSARARVLVKIVSLIWSTQNRHSLVPVSVHLLNLNLISAKSVRSFRWLPDQIRFSPLLLHPQAGHRARTCEPNWRIQKYAIMQQKNSPTPGLHVATT